MTPLTVDDYETLARERLEKSAWDYYSGGAGDERTLTDNRTAFARIPLRPRVLVDVSRIDLRTRVLGIEVPAPILLAPTAFNRLACDEGEIAAARAAGAAGTIMICSTLSTCRLEDVAAAATKPLWFQLYVYKDRAMTEELIARAESAGYTALVLTVDTPLLGRRYRDARNGFVLPEGLAMRNFEAAMNNAARWGTHTSFAAYVHDLFDASLTWDVVSWLRARTRLPILLKGIMTAEDAAQAIDAGADGVIVSNHGGRQLDDVPASIEALEEVAGAIAGRAEILLDGGIRRGTDVLKALALGARAVCIGRPYLWALAAAGEAGVVDVLRILREELSLAMALSGTPTIVAIDRALVRRPSQ